MKHAIAFVATQLAQTVNVSVDYPSIKKIDYLNR